MKISVAALVVPAVVGLALTGCGGGSHTPPAATKSVSETGLGSQEQSNDQVVDLGWSEGFHLPGATEWLDDHVCPEETPYLIDHDYAPPGTQLAKGVQIEEDTDPWAINVFAKMYASTPIDPAHDNAWVSDGYLIGLHSWSLHAEGQVDSGLIMNSVTHWGVAIGGEGHHYKILLHCTDDKSRAATGKYIPLQETTATKQEITRTLAAEDAVPMTRAELKAQRPSDN